MCKHWVFLYVNDIRTSFMTLYLRLIKVDKCYNIEYLLDIKELLFVYFLLLLIIFVDFISAQKICFLFLVLPYTYNDSVNVKILYTLLISINSSILDNRTVSTRRNSFTQNLIILWNATSVITIKDDHYYIA